jgi:hypothetical protein
MTLRANFKIEIFVHFLKVKQNTSALFFFNWRNNDIKLTNHYEEKKRRMDSLIMLSKISRGTWGMTIINRTCGEKSWCHSELSWHHDSFPSATDQSKQATHGALPFCHTHLANSLQRRSCASWFLLHHLVLHQGCEGRIKLNEYKTLT